MRRDTQTLLNSQHQLLQLLNQTGMFQLAKLWQNISDMLQKVVGRIVTEKE